mgnify:CR=1 FL=1
MPTLKMARPYPQQVKFFEAVTPYVAYGGARGGGKSWAARKKAELLALRYAGIQILLLRRTFPELRENHIIPMRMDLKNIAAYRESSKDFTFMNGSRIVLGYCDAETDVLQYQGQAYDVVFLEEATQFTEFQFQALTEINRSSGMMQEKFTPRFYLTCNPGGTGHAWVKRLFIDRDYKNSERAEDYTFIKATVYDNKFLMENSPNYVRNLENLPEDRKRAMLYGEWDVYDGQYFPEFDRSVHTGEPFEIPEDWQRYFVMDYGLDMLAAYWVALRPSGRAYFYRELYESNLIITEAVSRIKQMTPADEKIFQYFAPPDMWNRRQDSGKSVADIFSEGGIFLTRAKNDRVQGWYAVKEWLKVGKDEFGGKAAPLMIFRNCKNLIRCLPLAQHDAKNPNDVAKEPHEITHSLDALRYFVAGNASPAVLRREKKKRLPWQLQTEPPTGPDVVMEW